MNEAAEKGQMLPHDLDMERALIAAIIAENDILDRITRVSVETLPDIMFDPFHASIMKSILDLKERSRPANLITLKPLFGMIQFSDGVTVYDYVKTFQFAGTHPKIADIVDAIYELHKRRVTQDICERNASSVWDQGLTADTILSNIAQEVEEVQATTRPAGIVEREIDEALQDMEDKILNDDGRSRIPTGFADLDRMTGGWRRGEYVVLAGRPAMGKSSVAVSIARRVAKAGHGVAIFSLEMTNLQWMSRMVCEEVYESPDRLIKYSNAQRGVFGPGELERFRAGKARLMGLPFLINEQSGLTAQDIIGRTRRYAQRFENKGKKLGMVIVDHLSRVQPSSRYKGNPVREMSEISDAMARLAKTENVCVLALCQLNRSVEGRENKRAGLADLRESGAIEQDADMVLFPYRDAYYAANSGKLGEAEFEKHKLELNIAKQRNGETGKIELFTDMSANVICDVAKTDKETGEIIGGPAIIYSADRRSMR